MSTERQERPTRTVAATVMSKADAEDGFKLELQIPEFKSDYPTIATRVPTDIAARLKVGTVYNLVLERQSLKKGKTGERLYDYYWGLRNIAGSHDSESVPETPAPQGEPQTRDAERVSIERQTSLKAAVEIAGHRIAAGAEVSAQEVIQVARAFARFLETGLVPVAATAPVSPAEGSTTTRAPNAASRPASASRRPPQGSAGARPTGQSGEEMPEDDETRF